MLLCCQSSCLNAIVLTGKIFKLPATILSSRLFENLSLELSSCVPRADAMGFLAAK